MIASKIHENIKYAVKFFRIDESNIKKLKKECKIHYLLLQIQNSPLNIFVNFLPNQIPCQLFIII